MSSMFSGVKKFFESINTPKTEDFQEKGLLTPEQFVEAGDQLTNFGWNWQKSLTKQSKILTNANKQFLASKATSKKRIKSIMSQDIIEQNINGFMVPTIKQNRVQQQTEENFRIYKIYITYDEYYHTPRMWLTGNSFNGKPLNSKQIFEDIMSEYQNQTVTEQNHPYLDCRMLTVHPCKHSDVLKKFIKQSKDHGKKIKVHQTLLIFLKFMSSVMPTIQYDYTIDIQI